MNNRSIRNNRKHTLCFLALAKQVSPVYMVSEINMDKVIQAKNNMSGKIKLSFIGFIIFIVSRLIEKKSSGVNAKFTMDIKLKNNHRIVGSAMIPHANKLSLFNIQGYINSYKSALFESDKRFLPIRLLQKIPLFLGVNLVKFLMGFKKINSRFMGDFCISSVGHNPVDMFLPLSGSAFTFGMGHIKEKAVVVMGEVVVRPILLLTMVFDHCVIDGAAASDFLATIKEAVENFTLEGDNDV